MSFNIPEELKDSWTELNVLKLPMKLSSMNTPFIYDNEEIIYGCHLNVIRKWNCRTAVEQLYFLSNLESSEITALAKLQNGNIIIGDSLGKVYVYDDVSTMCQLSSIKVRWGKIIDILEVSPKYILVTLDQWDTQQYLVNIESGECLNSFVKRIRVYVFKQNLVLSDKKTLQIVSATDLRKILFSVDQSHSFIKASSDRFLILYNDNNKKCIILNKCNEIIGEVEIECQKIDAVMSIGYKTFILFVVKDSRICLIKVFFDGRNWQSEIFKYVADDQYDKINGMVCIGHWIGYATDSGLYFFNINGTFLGKLMTDECVRIAQFSDSCLGIKVSNFIYVIEMKKLKNKRKWIVGEGDFSSTEPPIKKHQDSYPNLQEAITATEVTSGPLQNAIERVENLKKQNVNIDAEQLRRKYKKRLFVGEGDFSYTEALIKKHQDSHPNLQEAITATEKEKEPLPDAKERVENLKKQKVNIHFCIDARDLHEKFSKADKFKRIHWNCPCGISIYSFRAFIKSCSMIQDIGDRIHVTLRENGNEYWQRTIGIVQATSYNGYCLIKKRNFGSNRYPGYVHKKFDGDNHPEQDAKKREFVFEKCNLQSWHGIRKHHGMVKYTSSSEDYFFICDTDNDSSDYIDSDN